MDSQNDASEKVDSFKIWPFLVSILDFLGVPIYDPQFAQCFALLNGRLGPCGRKFATGAISWMPRCCENSCMSPMKCVCVCGVCVFFKDYSGGCTEHVMHQPIQSNLLHNVFEHKEVSLFKGLFF